MFPNLVVTAAAALIPLVIGALWYSPMLFQNAWMSASGVTNEKMEDANMPLIFGITYVLSFFMCFILFTLVVHQSGFHATILMDPAYAEEGSDLFNYAKEFMDLYGQNHRTFGHGALHGGITAVFFGIPLLAINALFERHGLKYIAINGGYWFISLILMGGVMCQFA